MIRPRLLALLAVAALVGGCDATDLPERTNPLDPGWPVIPLGTPPARDFRVADQTPLAIRLTWVDAPGDDLFAFVERLREADAASVARSWSVSTMLDILPHGVGTFVDTLAAPGVACYRVAGYARADDAPASETLCLELPPERRVLPRLGSFQNVPASLAADGGTLYLRTGSSVLVWSVEADAEVALVPGPQWTVRATEAGGLRFAGDTGSGVRVWHITPNGAATSVLLADGGACRPSSSGVAASADGRVLVSLCPDSPTQGGIWDGTTGARLRTFAGGVLTDVSPDGQRVLSVSTTGVTAHDVTTGVTLWTQPIGSAADARFAAGGATVLAYAASGRLHLIDGATGSRLASHPTGGVNAPLVLSRDGERALVSLTDRFAPSRTGHAVVSTRTLDVVRRVAPPFHTGSVVIEGSSLLVLERGQGGPPSLSRLSLTAPWQPVPAPADL